MLLVPLSCACALALELPGVQRVLSNRSRDSDLTDGTRFASRASFENISDAVKENLSADDADVQRYARTHRDSGEPFWKPQQRGERGIAHAEVGPRGASPVNLTADPMMNISAFSRLLPSNVTRAMTKIAEQNAEDEREARVTQDLPYPLQVIYNLLAPLRLPVVRGRVNMLQTSDATHRWHLLPTGAFTSMSKMMASRLSIQDFGVLFAVMTFYLSTIGIALSLVYHSSAVTSGVKYFCEPELHTSSSRNLEDFSAAFNRAPMTRVSVSVWNRQKSRKRVDATFDVTPLVEDQRSGQLQGSKTMREFLQCRSPLARLVIRKKVIWNDFRQVQEEIRKRVSAQGFDGEVVVELERTSEIIVRRNSQLFHFVNNQITLILVLMSLVGLLFFWPLTFSMRRGWFLESTFYIRTKDDEYLSIVDSVLPDLAASAEDSDEATTVGDDERGRFGRGSSDSGSDIVRIGMDGGEQG